MMYRIYYEGRRKMALPITNREQLMALRDSKENLAHLASARKGDQKEKMKLLQIAYNIGHVDGALAGCKSIGSFFFHDVDCYDTEHSEQTKNLILEKKEEIGLVLLERSASGGWHLVCKRIPGTTILENQVRVSLALRLEMDTNTKDLQRVVFSTSASGDDLPYINDEIFTEPMTPEECEAEYARLKERERNGEENVPEGAKKAEKHYKPWKESQEVESRNYGNTDSRKAGAVCMRTKTDCTDNTDDSCVTLPLACGASAVGQEGHTESTEMPTLNATESRTENCQLNYNGIPYSDIISKWWEIYNEGKEPVKSNRDVLTFELAVNLRHICGFDAQMMDAVIPCYDHFPQGQKMKCIESALAEKRTQMPKRLKEVIYALRRERMNDGSADFTEDDKSLDDAVLEDECFYFNRLPKMPQGIKDSIDAVGPALSMPVITAICPAIGMLATGVRLDVHNTKNTLNLISYIAGDFASGKGSIDPVIDAWTSEIKAQDKIYQEQEDEWRTRKRAAKNKKDQPEEPKFPVRYLTLNNTVANLAERLANTEGKHAFSFTPEADTVAQKWKSALNDFSVMLRQSYDGSRYDREARSAEAVNVHIDHILWNVTMCGTPDALYRVVSNYTDGFQSRIAVARTPDNTYAPLRDTPYVLSELQLERIRQIAHLLILMKGDVVLKKLENKGRDWLERVRLEAIKSDDRVKARLRIRTCVTAQRMTCCLMLCRVCEQLIAKHGYAGAEKQLNQKPELWISMIEKAQTPQILSAYDVLADYLMDTALYFFQERIENAFASRDYTGNSDRSRIGKNDSIFARLDMSFGFDGALQHSISVKGNSVTRNQVRQMLKNWKKQGLVVQDVDGTYKKVESLVFGVEPGH